MDPSWRDPPEAHFPRSDPLIIIIFFHLMKPQASSVNKESFGHQSVLTAWAKDDGRPKKLNPGASDEETKAWAKAMTDWALTGTGRKVELQVLTNKNSALSRLRTTTGKEYATIMRQMKEERDVFKKLSLAIDSSKGRLLNMEWEAKQLQQKRQRIDSEKKKLDKQISVIKKELDE